MRIKLFTKLDRYLLKQSIAPLVFGICLYSVLVVLSANLPRLKWVIGTPLVSLVGWFALQFPTAIVQTLPIALVLAVLLTFGSLSAANELQAMQAGSISLARITFAFLFLGVGATVTSLVLNEQVVPVTNAKVGSVYWQLTSGGSGLWRLAKQNIPLDDYTLYFASTNRQTDEIFNVRVEAWQDKRLSVLFADRAEFVEQGLKLFNYQTTVIDFQALAEDKPSAEARLQDLVLADNRARQEGQSLTLTTSSDYDEMITRFSEGGFDDPRSISESYQDAHDVNATPQERRDAAVLFHRKLAEPFANLALLLVAVPVSVLYARSRSVAFGMSLVVTLVWYLLLSVGQLFAQSGVIPVWAGLWLGNVALAVFGLYLLVVKTNIR